MLFVALLLFVRIAKGCHPFTPLRNHTTCVGYRLGDFILHLMRVAMLLFPNQPNVPIAPFLVDFLFVKLWHFVKTTP